MNSRFLAEDFRNLLNSIEEISKENNQDETSDTDIEDLMTTDRPHGITIDAVKDIHDLIDFLDQFAELDTWRNHNAKYDDAFYENLPLSVLMDVAGLSQEDIVRITDNTKPYEGSALMHDNQVSIFGGD